MCARKIQGYIRFQNQNFGPEIWNVMYPCIFLLNKLTKQENTRIHNFSNLSKKSATRNVMNPCIFLALYMYARKLQGYITFEMITLFSSKKCGQKNTRIHNFSNLLLKWKLKSYVSLYFPGKKENTRIHNFSNSSNL